MAMEKTVSVEFLGSFGEVWRCVPILSAASLEGLAFVCDVRRVRDDALASLGEALDRYMRSRAFLALMRYGLEMMNRPTAFGLPNALRRFSTRHREREVFNG